MNDLETIQDLYDRHRYLEAYRLSTAYWRAETDLASLSVNELILGGRLARRLGGLRLSRWLLRVAYARDPSNPYVWYFADFTRQRRRSLYDVLRASEDQPDLDCDDAELRAWWLARQAVTWASLRDFSRADDYLGRAHALAELDSWVLCCESQVRGLADRWEDALEAAERAWQIDPGAPYAAGRLGESLLNLGRAQEAAQRLTAAAANSQSYEVAQLACWYQCALAETLDGNERHQTLACARGLAEKLPTLAPLADREAWSAFARTRLDIAELLDDHEEMEKWTREVKSPFHRRVLENLRKNPAGRRVVLSFHRAIQKHEACLPTSVSSVLGTMGVNLAPEAMVSEITYGGTPTWVAAEWLEQRGFVVRFFAAHPAVATRLLQNGLAFVLLLDRDERSHAVAVVGLDEAAGTLLVHDPMGFRTAKYLLEFLSDTKLPLGPSGMVFVPPEKAALVDSVLPAEDVDVMTASQRHMRALTVSGPVAARQIVCALAARHPRHPGTRWLQATQSLEEGRTGGALAGFQCLLNEFPGCPYVRRSLLSACRGSGNTALMREILAKVVDCGRLPGVQSDQEWRYPPASYVWEYADLLRLSAASRRTARLLLYSLLKREWAFAGAWHVLGDLLWNDHDTAGALLCLRLASCLATYDDHYARAYCDGLREAGREDEGLAWLETRARALGPSPRAAAAWTSWISALEDYGYPERALAACDEALRKYASSPELLAFAVPLFARMGRWEDSGAALSRLEATGHRPLCRQAEVDFCTMQGNLDAAIPMAEEWVRESPQSLPARRQLLDLISRRHGPRVAIDLAKRWCQENPAHEPLEEIYCGQLDKMGGGWKKDLLLHHRVKRNAEDGWAWRELTFRRLRDYESADSPRREKLQPRITHLLAQCDRTAPDAPPTLRAHAEWYAVRGLWSEAVSAWLKAIDAEPASFYSYRRIWGCSAAFRDAERRRVFQQIEAVFLGLTSRLENARDMIFLLAERFGFDAAEEAALKWMGRRADEPEVIWCAADLLLTYGHGRADAARALAMLEPAVRRFPYFPGLRFSLVDAYRRLGRDAEVEEALREIVRRHPGSTAAHVQLAWVQERRGKGDEALTLLESVTARDPLSAEAWDARAGMLIQISRIPEARATIREGLQRLAENAYWRERAIRRLLECDDDEGAVEAAREGIRVHPQGAYMWYLLGTTLNQARRFAAQGEIESCLRRSLTLNASLFAAADSLASLLVEQHRYDEAAETMRRILPNLADPSPALGRLAWIHRTAGQKSEARKEMVAALRAAPWYRWGWSVAMDWLLEDQAWDEAHSLLCPNPPELRTDTHFRTMRLKVLTEAGMPTEAVDSEWNALLRDFPEDVSLHLERYDGLRTSNRVTESVAVLNAIRPVDPENPYVLARSVQVLAEEHKKDEAIETLLRIWFAEVEKSPWPADYTWKVVQTTPFSNAAYQAARRRLDKGSQPTPQALSLIAERAMFPEITRKRERQPLWRAWFPGPGARDVMALLDLVDNAPWADGRYRAGLFRKLSDFGYQRLVVGYWKRRQAIVEADVNCWAEVGCALLGLSRKKEGRRLLAGWRGRAGVRMWMVTTYVACHPGDGRKDLQEINSTCRGALAGLAHDHCAKYLAHLQAEACVLLGDIEAFRQAWVVHRDYFNGKLEASEWFPNQRKHLLEDIPRIGRLLDQGQTKPFKKARRELRKKRTSPAD